MPNYTPNLNLAKPLGTEAYDISVPNANADKLDTAFGGMEAGLEYYFAQNGSGTFTGLNNLVGYIHNVTHIGENMRVVFKNTTANTGNVTINISGIGAIPILRKDSTQIPPGGLKANTVYMIYFDGTNFLLLGDGGEYGTAAAPQVLQGYTIGTEGGLVNGTIPTKNAQTFTPGMFDQTINSGQYLGGNQVVKGDINLSSSNVRSGVSIFGVNGTFSSLDPLIAANSNDIRQWKSAVVDGNVINGSLLTVAGGNTITPGRFNQTAVSGNSIVDNTISVAGSPNLIASNIKSGVNIFGVIGNFGINYKTGSNSSGTVTEDYQSVALTGNTEVTRTATKLTVTGLGFKPKTIIIQTNTYNTSSIRKINFFGILSDMPLAISPTNKNFSYQFSNNTDSGSNTSYYAHIPDADITNDGFSLPVPYASTSYNWIAIG